MWSLRAASTPWYTTMSLRNVLTRFLIVALLHHIYSLPPHIDNYIFNDGTKYQFDIDPINIQLPLNFPTNCYVTAVYWCKSKQKHIHVNISLLELIGFLC